MKHLSTLPANTTLTQFWSIAGPQSVTLAQHQTSTGSTPRVCWDAFNPENTKHYCSVSVMACFGMFWKSKKLQVKDYLFKWTEFFRIKYVRSWVVGLPNHPQSRKYMTPSIMILFYTIVISGEWLIQQTLTLCCFNVGPTSSPAAPHEELPCCDICLYYTQYTLDAETIFWLILNQRGWQWINFSQH